MFENVNKIFMLCCSVLTRMFWFVCFVVCLFVCCFLNSFHVVVFNVLLWGLCIILALYLGVLSHRSFSPGECCEYKGVNIFLFSNLFQILKESIGEGTDSRSL